MKKEKHIHKWARLGLQSLGAVTVIAVIFCEKCGEIKSKDI